MDEEENNMSFVTRKLSQTCIPALNSEEVVCVSKSVEITGIYYFFRI